MLQAANIALVFAAPEPISIELAAVISVPSHPQSALVVNTGETINIFVWPTTYPGSEGCKI